MKMNAMFAGGQLTGLISSTRGSARHLLTWNCSLLNSVATLSTSWPLNSLQQR